MSQDIINNRFLEESVFAIADGYCVINLTKNIVRGSKKAAGTVLFGLASVPGGTNVGKKIDDKESLRWYTKVKENLENMSKL